MAQPTCSVADSIPRISTAPPPRPAPAPNRTASAPSSPWLQVRAERRQTGLPTLPHRPDGDVTVVGVVAELQPYLEVGPGQRGEDGVAPLDESDAVRVDELAQGQI